MKSTGHIGSISCELPDFYGIYWYSARAVADTRNKEAIEYCDLFRKFVDKVKVTPILKRKKVKSNNMNDDKVYQDGVDSFLSGDFTTPIAALAKYPYPLNSEMRFKFAEGFKWAQNLFK